MCPTRRLPVLVAVLALSSAAADSVAARQADPFPTHRIDELFARFDTAGSPGAAVVVIVDGEIKHRRGFGHADLEHAVAIGPSTVFDIASVSKQFAGFAIATLVEQGAIDPADDIRTHLPELPDFGHTVTVDHLVHHTAGVRDWPGTLAVAGWRMDDVICFEQILTMARNQHALNFVPGAEYSYSNTGYNILARLVERVSGVSFREWTNEHIFVPLGMRNTHFHDDHTEVVPNRAQGYAPNGAGYSAVHNGLTALGSSSLFSTVDDLAQWAMALNAPSGDHSAVVRRMHERGVLNDGDTIAYAYGQSIGRMNGLETWRHTGSWAGFRTVLLRVPERQFAAIVLSNLGSFNPSQAADRIAEMLFGGEGAAGDGDGDATLPVPVDVDGAVLDAYVGTYRLGPATLLNVRRRGDSLLVRATGERTFLTRAVSEHEFYVPDYGATIVFRREGPGPADHIAYRGLVAPRVERHTHTPAELQAYVGRYVSDELAAEYVLRVSAGRLVAHHRRHGDIALGSFLRDEFRGAAWFLRAVEFDRDDDGTVTGFRVSNGRSRNLEFRRAPAGN